MVGRKGSCALLSCPFSICVIFHCVMNYSTTSGVTGICYVGYKNTSVNILFISHFTHCLFLLLIFPPFCFHFVLLLQWWNYTQAMCVLRGPSIMPRWRHLFFRAFYLWYVCPLEVLFSYFHFSSFKIPSYTVCVCSRCFGCVLPVCKPHLLFDNNVVWLFFFTGLLSHSGTGM
jgi:hypothetical protein